MRLQLAIVLMLASLSALMAQPADKPATAGEAVQGMRALQATARKGDIADLGPILVRIRDGLAIDRTCDQPGDQPGRLCSTKEAAIDLLATWVESFADRCPQSKGHADAEQQLIRDLRAQLESLAAGLIITAAGTRDDRERARRLQDALDKLERCLSLLRPEPRIWFASVAPDIPAHVKEQWIVNCGPTPYGRWTIMRTEGPSAARLEILGGTLDLKENGRGEYTLNGISKGDGRGAYKETGVAELSEMPGAPGQFMLVLRGTWSDRVADGRGGWVAKMNKFGDISFAVEHRAMPCPVAHGKP